MLRIIFMGLGSILKWFWVRSGRAWRKPGRCGGVRLTIVTEPSHNRSGRRWQIPLAPPGLAMLLARSCARKLRRFPEDRRLCLTTVGES